MGFPSSSGTMSAVMEQLSMIDKAFAASSSAAIILGFFVMTSFTVSSKSFPYHFSKPLLTSPSVTTPATLPASSSTTA